MSFVQGHSLNVVCSSVFRQRPAGRTQLGSLATKTYSCAWYRSACAQIVRVQVDLYPGQATATSTVTVTLPTGATWKTDGGLNGATHYHPFDANGVPASLVGYADVSACAVNTLLYWSVAAVQVSGTGGGISRLSITEVPLSLLDPPTDDTVDQSWTVAGGHQWDGDNTTAHGFTRFNLALDQARKYSRRHFALVGIEATDASAAASNGLWYADGTSGASYQSINLLTGVSSQGWRMQVADLYNGTSETWKLACRYRTATATGGVLRLYPTGISGAAAVAQDLTLTATSGAWAWVSGDVTIPVDGTNNAVELEFQCKNNQAAGNLIQFASIILIHTPS